MRDRQLAHLRLLRGTVFTACAALLGVLAHVLGGGSLPEPIVVVLLVGLVGCVGAVLTRRYRGFGAIVATAAGCQLVIHEALMAGPGPFEHVPHSAMSMHGGMHLAGSAAGSHVALAHGSMSPAMFLGHTVATILAALLLARGERAIAWLAALVAPRLPGAPTSTPPAPSRQVFVRSLRLVQALLLACEAARAPPCTFRLSS